jgi:predicted Rossmann-fold nucleotide-binding protein
MPKSICVFAGSSSGAHPQYTQAARELGDCRYLPRAAAGDLCGFDV